MSVERKQGLIPIPFLFASKTYYATLGDYKPRNTYHSWVKSIIPEDWIEVRKGAWYNFFPPKTSIPESGFKIHISSGLGYAKDIVLSVTRIVSHKNIPFKFLVDEVVHELSNSKNFSAWGSGKFITIFPRDQNDFFEVARILADNIPTSEGPYI